MQLQHVWLLGVVTRRPLDSRPCLGGRCRAPRREMQGASAQIGIMHNMT